MNAENTTTARPRSAVDTSAARAWRERSQSYDPCQNVRPHWSIWRRKLNGLYFGEGRAAVRFQSVWLIFDAILIAFFVIEPLLEMNAAFYTLDYAIAGILAVDLAARGWAFGKFGLWLRRPIVLADFAVLASLLAPALLANLAFLRMLRAYSLINSGSLWRIVGAGRYQDTPMQDMVKAGSNLAIFVFITTSLVHASFAGSPGSGINSFADSLYFTVTSLTTTGYGDITLPGPWGRWLSILIMIIGVSLFLRLIQVMMRPAKVVHPCPSCGLRRHEGDAIHCKACGEPLTIAHDNE